MSVSILRYVPVDPNWQPAAENVEAAVELLALILPGSGDIAQRFDEKPRFYDPGENWSGVECPSCNADAEPWWGDAMDRAYASEFERLNVVTPCCGSTVSLNNLHYVWPAAFGRFALEVSSPGAADTTAEQDKSIADCIGAPLRKIWVRI